MNVFAFIAVYAGLAVLLLAALSPIIVELDSRFPVGRRERSAAPRHAAKPVKGTRITAHA
ncbi:hypothetical protein ACWEOE_04030 [Amycolatopsis sp. NPDC004368]